MHINSKPSYYAIQITALQFLDNPRSSSASVTLSCDCDLWTRSHYISETVQAVTKVTIEYEYEVLCELWNGVISGEWPWISQINLDFKVMVLFKGEYLKNLHFRDSVSIGCLKETIFRLSNDTSFNDLDWPQARISRSQYFWKLSVSKMVQDRAIVTIWTLLGMYVIYQIVSFPVTLSDPILGFRVTVIFKFKFYSNWCMLYCPTAENLFTYPSVCWHEIPQW